MTELQLPDGTWCVKRVIFYKSYWGYGMTREEAIKDVEEQIDADGAQNEKP